MTPAGHLWMHPQQCSQESEVHTGLPSLIEMTCLGQIDSHSPQDVHSPLTRKALVLLMRFSHFLPKCVKSDAKRESCISK